MKILIFVFLSWLLVIIKWSQVVEASVIFKPFFLGWITQDTTKTFFFFFSVLLQILFIVTHHVVEDQTPMFFFFFHQTVKLRGEKSVANCFLNDYVLLKISEFSHKQQNKAWSTHFTTQNQNKFMKWISHSRSPTIFSEHFTLYFEVGLSGL